MSTTWMISRAFASNSTVSSSRPSFNTASTSSHPPANAYADPTMGATIVSACSVLCVPRRYGRTCKNTQRKTSEINNAMISFM